MYIKPSTANYVLKWDGAKWVESSLGSVTWGGDLALSTDTEQIVSSITGGGSGTNVAVNCAALGWAANTSPVVGIFQLTKPAGNGALFAVHAQSAGDAIGTGGILSLLSGSGGTKGTIRIGHGGAEPFAGQGHVGVQPGFDMQARDVANSKNMRFLQMGAADHLVLGGIDLAGVQYNVGAGKYHDFQYAGSSVVRIQNDYMDFGTAPASVATAGYLRANNAKNFLMQRNAANTANIAVAGVDSGNNLFIGTNLVGGERPAITFVDSSDDVRLAVAGNTILRVTNNQFHLAIAPEAGAAVPAAFDAVLPVWVQGTRYTVGLTLAP